MNKIVKRIMNKCKKNKTFDKKINYLKKEIALDSSNPLPLILLARFDDSYFDEALEIINNLTIETGKEILVEAYISGIYIYLKKKLYYSAINLSNKYIKFNLDIDINSILCLLYLVKNGDCNNLDINNGHKYIKDFVLLYNDYKQNNQIGIQTFYDSLIDSSVWVEIFDTKETYNISLFFDYSYIINNRLPFFICSSYFSLFCLILEDDIINFIDEYNETKNKNDLTTYLNDDENYVLEAIYDQRHNYKISLNNFYFQFKKICEIMFEYEEYAIKIKEMPKDRLYEILTYLINNKILMRTPLSLELTSFGEMIASDLRIKTDTRELKKLNKGLEMLMEGIDCEDPDESILYFNKGKEIFPWLFDADFFTLVKKDEVNYQNLRPLYDNVSSVIYEKNIPISKYGIDTIDGYLLACFKRISDKLIELALDEENPIVVDLLCDNLGFFKELSLNNYVVARMILSVKPNDVLSGIIKSTHFPLTSEISFFLELLDNIKEPVKNPDSERLMSLLHKVNPHICGLIFDFIDPMDIPIDGAIPLDEYINYKINGLDIAINLVNIYYSVYHSNVLLPLKEKYYEIISNYVTEPLNEIILSGLKDLFSCQTFISKISMTRFIVASDKTPKQFKALDSFNTMKFYAEHNIFTVHTAREIVENLLKDHIIILTNKGYTLTLYGYSLITKYFDKKNNNNIIS